MLTAFTQRELVERARDAGAMAYVVKPFTAADLVPAIEIARSPVASSCTPSRRGRRPGRAAGDPQGGRPGQGRAQTQLSITEPDAFRWIQKTAMDRRLGMREVAEAVITGMPARTSAD